MGTMKYWEHQRWNIATYKGKTPQKCRIGNNCFASVAVVGGKLYISHPHHINHVHKDHNDLLSYIITFVTNVSCGDTILWWNSCILIGTKI